jgi:YqaJ-like viral recombinase domain
MIVLTAAEALWAVQLLSIRLTGIMLAYSEYISDTNWPIADTTYARYVCVYTPYCISQTATVQDAPAVAAQVLGEVYKARGRIAEPTVAAAYEALTSSSVQQRNDKYYKRALTVDNTAQCTVYLGGRVDGISASGDRVIEMKSRQKRLFTRIPEYEQIQMQAYMFLTGIAQCDFVQKYAGKTRISTHSFDAEQWQRISTAATAFGCTMLQLFSSTDAQDKLLLQWCNSSNNSSSKRK